MTKIEGSNGWYWCCDYASGDLYEAEELFRNRQSIPSNRLVFIHYPDGQVVEPMEAKEGQYFGAPAFENGKLQILMVDFPASAIRIFQYEPATSQTNLRAEIPLSEVKDCYNLLLMQAPLMLTRQGMENVFQVIWPEKAEFPIGNTESFYGREGDRMYFSRWKEEPDYWEEVVIRRYPSGEILEVISGSLYEMPDGQRWVLR
ncbi:MAG: hypothetical protein ACOX7F_00905 [Eubacteriales bacterium]